MLNKGKLSVLITLLLLVQITISQNYQTVEEVNNACATLGFSANEDAEIAVDNILDQIGIPRNFTIQECPNINNAVAKIIESSSGVKERYILFDGNFFSDMDDKAGSEWAAKSILAHEIGHHLSGHALNNKGSNHQFELEADEFSGFVLAKLGATKEEAQSAIQILRYEKATSTHPAKADRLIAIERGWNKAKGISVIITKKEEDEIKALKLYRNGELAYQEHNFSEALEYFNNAKDLGNEDAYFYLSTIYFEGLGVSINYNKAYNLAQKGYNLGSVPANYQLAYYLFNGYGVKTNKEEGRRLFKKDFQIKWFKDQYNKNKTALIAATIGKMYQYGYGGVKLNHITSLQWYELAAQQDDLIAQNNLGYMYSKGKGLEMDSKKAVFWYRKAANQGYAKAQSHLGYMYRKGYGIEKDNSEAIYWYRKATNQNYAPAQNHLGYMYRKGYGIEKDLQEAVKLYRKAAEQNYPLAQYSMGYMYRKGYGVKQDDYEAVKWYQKAAEEENPKAQYNLGYMYYKGYGIVKDDVEAVFWFRKSAEQDNARAQTYLGFMYDFGHGISKDDTEAVYWYRKAAEQEDAQAQTNLGFMYSKGSGVEKDMIKAVNWWKKAARQGNKEAQTYLTDLGEIW